MVFGIFLFDVSSVELLNGHDQQFITRLVAESTFSTAHRSSKLVRNGVVRRDVSVADGVVFDGVRVTSLGIVAAVDVEARCYHRSLYLLNCYLIDYCNVFVTVDN